MNLGSFAGGRSNPLIITLPTSFQSANYYIKTSIWNKNNSYGVDYDFQIEHLEKGKAYLYGQEFNDGTSFVREYVDFFAIGQWNSSGSNSLEIGMVVAWTLSSNPSDNYLECNGQGVDKNKYPKLYQLMHNVPDYRGVFLRGLGGNSAALGALQGDAIRNITGTMGGSNSVDVGLWDYGTGVFYQFNQGRNSVANGRAWYSYVSQGMGFDASRVVPVANENRPVNKAVRYFIKAK